MTEDTIEGRGVKISLHLDGLLMLIFGVVIYGILRLHWGLFAAFLLAPDLFMLGYLVNNKAGAFVYNLGHLLLWPVSFSLLGLILGSEVLLSLGIIWLCHIGMDHAFGYGFKFTDSFKHTHINGA